MATIIESTLEPTQFDITVGGVRYGLVWKIYKYDSWRRQTIVRWRARFDVPERISAARFLMEGYFESYTRDEAIHGAFEAFVDANDLPQAECVHIGLALFGDDAPVVEVLAEPVLL